MSFVGFINLFFFQFLFVRLTRIVETTENAKFEYFAIQGFILPLTGWSRDFIYLSEPKFFTISKPKIIK